MEILPDVRQLRLTFIQPTPEQPLVPSDLAEQLIVDFKNGTQLKMSGAYLWKFRESIPTQLGSDEFGWNDENPHGPGTTEFLMVRLRATYDAMLEEEGIDINARPPLSATLDLTAKTADLVFPADLPESIWMELAEPLGNAIAKHSGELRTSFQATIREALAKPRQVAERYADGQFLRLRFVEQDWPAQVHQKLTLAKFLSELGPEEQTPWCVFRAK